MIDSESAATWRPARPTDDDAIASMCLELNKEDPGLSTVDETSVRRTLAVFRAQPHRGRAVVVELGGVVRGYALLVPFWSNELGGCVCDVDELFVQAGFRSRGIGTSLFEAITARALFADETVVALALGVTSGNHRARALYERLGFRAVGTTMVRSV
jgi:GNAT superfamily N-acetyltransferase